MTQLFRCPACRTRRATFTSLLAHVRSAGHKVCNCGGYRYPHRPESPCCEKNPEAALNIAARAGEPINVLMEIAEHIAFETQGKRSTKCPF